MRFDLLSHFIFFIIGIKICFIVFSLSERVLKKRSPDSKSIQFVGKWRERTEFIFMASMAVLLLVAFNPHSRTPVTGEMRILFYLFGWILLVTANWGAFFHEAPWFRYLQSLVSG